MMTDQFNWRLTKEIYQFLWGRWDVTKAKEIIIAKPRAIAVVGLQTLRHYVERPEGDEFSAGHTINWDLVDNGEVDTDFPLIGVMLTEGPWIIDGWHRMAKGFENGQDDYPVACLDKNESGSIRCG